MARKKLEYIEGTGSQYIDIGFIPNGNTKVEVDWEPSFTGKNNFLFGVRQRRSANDSNSYTVFINASGNYIAEYFGTRQTKTVPSVYSRTFVKFGVESSIGSVEFTYTKSSNSSTGNLYIGELHNVSEGGLEGTYITGKIYSFKIWDNATLVRDLQPCSQDGVPGLYDNVNKVFYASVTSTPFVAGPELPSVNGQVNVNGQWRDISAAYVNVNGTWKEATAMYVNVNGTWKESI